MQVRRQGCNIFKALEDNTANLELYTQRKYLLKIQVQYVSVYKSWNNLLPASQEKLKEILSNKEVKNIRNGNYIDKYKKTFFPYKVFKSL